MMKTELSGKKLLILGANPETTGLVIKAKEMGIITYVTDYYPFSYAKKYCDIPSNIDATDFEKLKEIIISEKIDGVLCGVAESLLSTYIKLCEFFNFPHFGNDLLFSIFANKKVFKDTCRKYNVEVVDEYFPKNYCEEELKKIPLPVVVKPIDSCSSKGISVCKTLKELIDGTKKALEYSPSKKIIIEKYMTGEEVIAYYAFQNGEPSLVAMCDRYTNKDQKGVAQLPTSYIYPSKHLKTYLENNDKKVKSMFKELSVQNGFMFIQSFVDEHNKIKFYEAGYRLNGAQEHYLVGKTTGIDAKECLLNLALMNKESDDTLSQKADPNMNNKICCKLSPLITCGKIKEIKGLNAISSLKEIVSINPSYNNGDEVNGYGTLKQIVCRFFIVCDDNKHLKRIIDKIYSEFDVIDENGNSMLLKNQFNSKILLDDYE